MVETEADAQSKVTEVKCEIGAIVDIFTCAEDGPDVFPKKVVEPLSADERQLLLMIEHRKEPFGNLRMYMIVESAVARDAFLDCLRILCVTGSSDVFLESCGLSTW